MSDGSAKLVLLKLADSANDDGICWPSQGYLAEQCEMSERNVRFKLEKLRGLGLLRVINRTGENGQRTSNVYDLASGSPLPLEPAEGSSGSPLPHKRKTIEPSVEEAYASSEAIGSTLPEARPRDLIFDALVEVCAIELSSLTPSGRGPLNRAAKELRSVDATPDEVHRRAEIYGRRYELPLTPSALAKHWGALNVESSNGRRLSVGAVKAWAEQAAAEELSA